MQTNDCADIQQSFRQMAEQFNLRFAQLFDFNNDQFDEKSGNLSEKASNEFTRLIRKHWIFDPLTPADRILPAVLDGETLFLSARRVSPTLLLGLVFPFETRLNTVLQQTDNFTRELTQALSPESSDSGNTPTPTSDVNKINPDLMDLTVKKTLGDTGWESELIHHKEDGVEQLPFPELFMPEKAFTRTTIKRVENQNARWTVILP